jgi:hypothetical protein
MPAAPPRVSARTALVLGSVAASLFALPAARASAVAALKADLVRACALCDRGFSARPAQRRKIDALVAQLAPLSPCAEPTAGLDGSVVEGRPTPIVGLWELVYTDAADVSSLVVNPLTIVGSIYQDIRQPPEVVNVIELSPRVLSAQRALDTTFRVKVFARALARSPTRAGLAFEKLGGTPVSFFGADVPPWLSPPTLSLGGLPSLPFGLAEPLAEQIRDGAFFDVDYLDGDLLVIRQNRGGYFVSVRVDDYVA